MEDVTYATNPHQVTTQGWGSIMIMKRDSFEDCCVMSAILDWDTFMMTLYVFGLPLDI